MAKTATDIEALTLRLGVERQKRAELEAAVAAAAREVAKAGGTDLASVIDRQASVAAQDRLIHAVEGLLAEVQQAEQDRQREVAIKGAKSRLAAIQQHLLKRARLAKEYQDAVRTIVTVNDELQTNADQIEKLSPPYPFWLHSGAMGALHINGRRKLLAREFLRQFCRGQNLSHYSGPDNHPDVDPNAPNQWLAGDFIIDMKDITEVVKEQHGYIVAALEQALGLASAPVIPAPVAQPIPAAAPPAPPEPWVDAIAGPRNPHPEGSQEWAEFNEVLAGGFSEPVPSPLDAAVAAEVARFAAEAKAKFNPTTATEGEPN
jgi:hypothetical protein